MNFFLTLKDDNPDVIKVFSKATTPLTLEFIKGCILGTAKTIIIKSLKLINEDFPKVESKKLSIFQVLLFNRF